MSYLSQPSDLNLEYKGDYGVYSLSVGWIVPSLDIPNVWYYMRDGVPDVILEKTHDHTGKKKFYLMIDGWVEKNVLKEIKALLLKLQ